MKLDTLEAVAAPEGVPDFRKLYHSDEELLAGSLAADRYDLAKRACENLTEFARKLGDDQLALKSRSSSERVASLLVLYDGVKEAESALEKDSADASANLVVGKFRCFAKEQWEIGLPLLAHSSDDALNAISKQDLASPKDPAEQLKLADQWWGLGESRQGNEQSAIQRRAAYWYAQAARKLNGLAREKAEKRAAFLSSSQPTDTEIEVRASAVPEPKATRIKPPDAAASVERDAQNCRTAKDGLLVYKLFLADGQVSDDAKDLARKHLSIWEDRAAKDYVRLGQSWVSADTARKAHDDAENLVGQAIDLFGTNNDSAAKDRLEKASKLDPEAIRADFLLGLVYVLDDRNYKVGKSHFSECVRREPQDVCSLNNLALIETLTNDHDNALKHLRAAVGVDPRAPELASNVQRILDQVGKKNLSIPSSCASGYADLYSTLVKESKSSTKGSRGWLYMLPLMPAKPSDDKVALKLPTLPANAVIFGGGSGFVVSPHFILTNRHVAENASGFLVSDPENPDKPKMTATLGALSEDHDLALLRCDELNAPPVHLDAKFPGRGTDIMLLGYPEFFEIGTGLKSTRGSIVGLPEASNENMCLYDATSNHGNSGGPVSDNRGNVIAIHRAGFTFSGKLGGGIPIEQAISFISDHVPGFGETTPNKKTLEWSQVDALVSKSTVLILCEAAKDQRVAIGGKMHSESIEDRACVACRGTGMVPCPDCHGHGTITVAKQVDRGPNPLNGIEMYGTEHFQENCRTCGGTGNVRCQVCDGRGVDGAPDSRQRTEAVRQLKP